jgi:hypothetical protein
LPEQIRKDCEVKSLSSRFEFTGVKSTFWLKLDLADSDPDCATQILSAIMAVYMKRVEGSPTFTARVVESTKQY